MSSSKPQRKGEITKAMNNRVVGNKTRKTGRNETGSQMDPTKVEGDTEGEW
jgi:hypothetical protein